jgi:hypothetical protein
MQLTVLASVLTFVALTLSLVALDEICPRVGQWYIRSDALVKRLLCRIGARVLVKLFVFGTRSLSAVLRT